MRLSLTACCWIIALGCTADVAAFQELEESRETREAVKVIHGLKDRRLFGLAQTFAAQQLASEKIDRIGRCSIVLELIKSKTAEAISLTGNERQNAWLAALQIAVDFIKADPEHPRKILIDVQVALTHLSHGSLIGQEVAAEIVQPTEKKQALDQFRLATAKFRDVEKEIDRLLPIQRSKTLKPGELNPEQLVNLKNSVRYQQARVNLSKAELYEPADRLNQIDALNQVLNRLDEVLRQSNPQLPMWWNAQVSRARCFRLMERPENAAQIFANLPDVELTEELKADILTEQLLLAAIQANGSNNELLEAAGKFRDPPAQLQLAQLQLLMAIASDQPTASKKQWQGRATKLVAEIETNQGRYWGRRAEILLVGSIQPPTDKQPVASSDFDILIRQADTAFRKQNYDDAIKAYTKAVAFADKSGDADRAIALTVRLARCHELEKQHQQAAEKLFDVAIRFPETGNSAAVYLRGCWNWAQITHGDPDNLAEYIEHLKKQIATWPDAASTNQARLWLGHSLQANLQWQSACRAYLDIAVDSPHLLSATQYIGRCAKRWIDDEKSNTASGEIVDLIRLKLNLLEGQQKEEWNEAERRLLLVMIDIGLPDKAVDSGDALKMLDAAIGASTDDEHGWRQQACVWRMVIVASQNAAEAELLTALKNLPNDSELMKICFDGLQSNLDGGQRTEYSGLIAMICDKALADENVGPQQTFWKLNKAVAEIDSGNVETGVGLLAKLASQSPKSRGIQLAYARALTRQGSDLPAAINQWRRIAAKLKKGSEAWFESKYNIIVLMIKNDQADEARKLLEYLKVTSPDWQKSGWQTQFESLTID